MILGILSDTHDRVDAMAAGMYALRAAGAEFFIHCGDVGGEGVLDLLAGEGTALVWGNNDWDRQALEQYAARLRIASYPALADLTVEGKRIAVIHGDDVSLKKKLLDQQMYDYLFQGHTHLASDSRVGRTRIINPGALHRARVKSVATLDLSSDELRVLPLLI